MCCLTRISASPIPLFIRSNQDSDSIIVMDHLTIRDVLDKWASTLEPRSLFGNDLLVEKRIDNRLQMLVLKSRGDFETTPQVE
ncbi:hypothetical protein CEXT_348251 [Caerostris extrusa]|uniref:Uncharacterized protein n=1 Tax=Caerostris extrusa TaxID=172846 RepID=A0AAV4Y4I7_CAEEX|nr:hypothetical protein CEXT_348251 [Caerostris extrusa]